MAYIPSSDSVVAFQSNPANLQASVTGTVTVRGSVITINPANQSVSGTVQADVRGSVATVIIGGSIAASFTPPANQSVSGTVGSSVLGSVPVVPNSYAVDESAMPATPVLMPIGGEYRASVTTYLDGDAVLTQYDVNGNKKVTLATLIAGEDLTNNVLRVSVTGGTLNLNPAANQSVSGTVGASVIGHAPVVIVGGSIAASFTPPANQSVSGTVGASIIGLTPVHIASGSVAVATGNSSVQVLNFPANQSVSGAISVSNFPTNQNVSGSVVASGTVTALQLAGSVLAVNVTPAANQSVSGTVGASVLGSVPVVPNSYAIDESAMPATPNILPIGGEYRASVTTYLDGDAVVDQADVNGNKKVTLATLIAGEDLTNNVMRVSVAGGTMTISGSVITVGGAAAANQSVSGTVGASVIGHAPVVIVGGSIAASFTPPANQSVSGAISVSNFPTSQNVNGSVVAFQGTTPWANTNIGSVITVGQGSIAVNIIAGSIAASFTPPANQSVSGTVGASIIGAPPVTQGGTWIASVFGNMSVIGTVPVTQVTSPWIITGSVQASLSPAANQSVSGTVGASVIGQAPVFNVGGISSVSQGGAWTTSVVGSVTAYQGVVPWVVNFQNSSIIAINAGSVIAIPSGSTIGYWDKSPSIVGTYVSDAAHGLTDKGIFVMGVRNDTMASVVSTNLDYSRMTVGAAGETVSALAPITAWTQGTNSVFNGTSMVVIAAGGSSVFNYITGVQIANVGATSVLVTLSGGTSSIIGYTVAPQGGGSNIRYEIPIKTRQNAAFTASISGVASVFIAAQGFTARL